MVSEPKVFSGTDNTFGYRHLLKQPYLKMAETDSKQLITKEQMEHMFKLFQQMHKPNTTIETVSPELKIA